MRDGRPRPRRRLFFHRLYGLSAAATRPVPGLPPAAPADPELRVTFGSLPPLPPAAAEWYTSPRLDDAGTPLLRVRRLSAARHHLRYADGTEFVVDAPAGEVWARWPEPLAPEDAATYLTGPVMGFLLRMRGATCLHASAVEAGGRAVLLAGPAGAGKSTTAAAFAAAGRAVLSDDVSPLLPGADGFAVQPAYPQLRLWGDSAAALFGAEEALPLLTPGWDKRYLDLAAAGRFHDAPLPLAAVYLLGEREAGADGPRFAEVRGGRAVMELVANVYMGYLPGREAPARDLERLARLARVVPVVRVSAPDDAARLAELVRAIAEDLRTRIGGG